MGTYEKKSTDTCVLKPILVGEKKIFFLFDAIFWSNEPFSGQGDRGGLNFYPYNHPYADFRIFHLNHRGLLHENYAKSICGRHFVRENI